jgi:hypothetical protein
LKEKKAIIEKQTNVIELPGEVGSEEKIENRRTGEEFEEKP